MARAKGVKLRSSKVPMLRANPAGRVRPPLGMPHVTAPRIKAKKGQRNYAKIQPMLDPAEQGGPFANSGFGQTGMTGES